MRIGWAVDEMMSGNKVRRRGWNGKGQYVCAYTPDQAAQLPLHGMTLPFVYIKTVQGDYVPWLCSQTDLLSDDWEAAL